MLDDRVRTGEHQAGVTVVETHEVGRLPARSADLDDLAHPRRMTHTLATHVEPVPDDCMHPPTTSPACTHYPVPADTLTVYALATASIHLDADGWYRLCEHR